MTPSKLNYAKEEMEIIIGLLELTLGDMPSREADEIVELCINLLKGKKPPKTKASARYYICRLKNINW